MARESQTIRQFSAILQGSPASIFPERDPVALRTGFTGTFPRVSPFQGLDLARHERRAGC